MKNKTVYAKPGRLRRLARLLSAEAPTICLLAGNVLIYGLAYLNFTRSDPQVAEIHVPAMTDPLAVRIITNAVLDEIVGRYDGTRNEYEVDLTAKKVLYHESRRLLSGDYQHRIEARIREVGFSPQLDGVRVNPPGLVSTVDGPRQLWPGRCTAFISVPDMVTNTDANRVVNAIAYARLGYDDSRIEVDPESRRIVAAYEGLFLARENIEHAIASVGFRANDVPARLGRRDADPHGWTPVSL